MKKFISNPKLLAKKIHDLIKEDPYAQSLVSLEQFYANASDNIFDTRVHSDTFNSYFIYSGEDVIDAVLNVKIIFDVAEIDFLFVRESQRGKGIAQKLLRNFEDECRKLDPPVIPRLDRGIQRILLEVGENNISAVNLYKKSGFKQISVRKKYYKGIEDALIMEKVLWV